MGWGWGHALVLRPRCLLERAQEAAPGGQAQQAGTAAQWEAGWRLGARHATKAGAVWQRDATRPQEPAAQERGLYSIPGPRPAAPHLPLDLLCATECHAHVPRLWLPKHPRLGEQKGGWPTCEQLLQQLLRPLPVQHVRACRPSHMGSGRGLVPGRRLAQPGCRCAGCPRRRWGGTAHWQPTQAPPSAERGRRGGEGGGGVQVPTVQCCRRANRQRGRRATPAAGRQLLWWRAGGLPDAGLLPRPAWHPGARGAAPITPGDLPAVCATRCQ